MSINMYSWTRNTMVASSILTILYFSRWRPIWPPNQTKRPGIQWWNTMVAFSILTILYFSRWRPIWPPNQTKSHISAEKHDRETNFVSINMYSWTRNTMVAFSFLTILYFSRWRPIWLPNQTKSHISAE